jgi:hypothetical protein
LEYDELNDQHIKQWCELEERSVEQNAYLSPYFVLPALKHFPLRGKPIFVFVEKRTNHVTELMGVGVLVCSPRTIKLPVPHLKIYKCPYAYLTGLLVDRQHCKETAKAFLSFFHDSRLDWCAVEFVNRRKESELVSQLDIAASEFEMCWIETESQRRPILLPERTGDANMKTVLSNKRRKILRQNLRRLNELGKVEWRVVKGQEIEPASIDTFLGLEHMGWRKERKCSILSHPNQEAFFREMTNEFAQAGRLFFTELSMNGKVIASTCNLISGGAGFAFKIGWDEAFSKFGIGILNEVEFLKHFPEHFPHLQYVDSGAEEDSFIEKLWIDHIFIASGIYVSNRAMKPLIQGLNFMRKVKRRFLN